MGNKKTKVERLEEEYEKAVEEGDDHKEKVIGEMIDRERPWTKWEKLEGVRF